MYVTPQFKTCPVLKRGQPVPIKTVGVPLLLPGLDPTTFDLGAIRINPILG